MKKNVLCIGPDGRVRRHLLALLGREKTLSVDVEESGQQIAAFFAEHRIDVVFVSAGENLTGIVNDLRRINIALPLLVYGENLSCRMTRDAFLSGVIDVLEVNGLSEAELHAVLERALDPLHLNNADEVQQQYQCVRILSQRGRHFEQLLREGNPPIFYMNGDRAVFLRADILCTADSLLWQQDVAWEWAREFNVNNSFLFSSTDNTLHIGAIVEQDYNSAASFKRAMDARLERFFDTLKAMRCIAAVHWCSSDYLSLTTMRHLDRLVELVYYLGESAVIQEDTNRRNTVLSEELYTRFYTAALTSDADAMVRCVDEAVQILSHDKPSPSLTRGKMNRFLWNLAAAGCQNEIDFSLYIESSRLCLQRDRIVDAIGEIMRRRVHRREQSPMHELIRRIEENPGLDINIDQAARDTHFSRSHFCKLFRELTGMSFTSFVTAKRLETACTLLEKTGMRIEEIARFVGIENTWYFKKLFLKEMNVSVEEWREGVRSRSGDRDAAGSLTP